MRQRIDELADQHEDAVTGMVTYPVALLLLTPAAPSARAVIRSAWERCRALTAGERDNALAGAQVIREDAELRAASEELIDLLESAGVFDVCHREADALCADLAARIAGDLGRLAYGSLNTVLDLKRALLDRLAAQRWRNAELPHTLEQIRRDTMTRSNRR